MVQHCCHLEDFPCSCKLGDGCPIVASHRRLREAHRHWHDALRGYGELDVMRTYVNGTLQALRNVTFVLQGAKRHLPEFDNWYGPWQNTLKSDPVMQWAVDARNHVTKSGDFMARSSARVSLVGSMDGPLIMEVEALPSIPDRALAAQLMRRLSPTPSLLKSGMISVERRWVDVNLPQVEVLEALGHVFSRLAAILHDCHLAMGKAEPSPWLSPAPVIGTTSANLGKPFFPPCMILPENARTSWIRMRDGARVSIRAAPMQFNPVTAKIAEDHYRGTGEEMIRSVALAKGMQQRVERLWLLAKYLMEKDGFYAPTAWLIRGDEVVWFSLLEIPENSSKHLIWDLVHREAVRRAATEVIVVSERWKSSLDPAEPDRRAEDAPDRCEYLGVDALNSNGLSLDVCGLIERRGEMTLVHDSVAHSNVIQYYLHQFRDSWGLPKFSSPEEL